MMEFFDKLGKKASEAAKMTADKTSKLAKETKIKFKIGELKTQISDIYEEIGKKVYEKHIREEDICIKKDLEEQCTKIDVLSDEIDSLLKECLALKNKKQCSNCFKELEKEDKFCPNCGKKQSDEPQTEEQIEQELKNIEVDKDNASEKQIVIEELEQNTKNNNNSNNNSEENEEEKTTLEKTVEIESNVKLAEEEENKEE